MKKKDYSFWYNPRHRGYLFQAFFLFFLLFVLSFFFTNLKNNLSAQNIASGFDFLKREAGFEISESLLSYSPKDSYLKALLVGLFNTLKIAVIGNIFALSLGGLLGVWSLSSNWMIAKISQLFGEGVRNIPLLLQLLFWYTLFTELLPSVKEAYHPLPGVFFTQRGLYFATLAENPALKGLGLSFLLGALFFVLFLAFFFFLFKRKRYREKGELIKKYVWPIGFCFLLLFPLLSFLIIRLKTGIPLHLDFPLRGRYNFSGGFVIAPEFMALCLCLVLYTGAFNAEIVRAAIQSVPKGQWEASQALGFSKFQILRFIILPQSLKVMIPPLTSQVLNLVKNSSLAVAIGYPDFVSVANTTLNQTGQAVECVFLIMVVYLVFSLSTSLAMNFFHRHWAKKELGL